MRWPWLYRMMALLTMAVASCGHAQDRPLNVLLIIVDDLAPVLSSYGGPVATPSMDKLAARGVRFSSNYANVPVCGASRASLLSGLAPSVERFLSFDSRLDQDAPGAVSLPALFQQHGWHTVANGKVFDVIADSSEGFSEPVWSPAGSWYGKEPDGRGEHLQAAYIDQVSGSRLPYFERLPVADDDYPDGQVAAKTVEDLERLAAGKAPFFLAVGFRKPHLPFNAPDAYWENVVPADEMLPVTWATPAPNMPDSARHRSPELRAQYDALPYFGDPDDATAAGIVRAYHAAVRYADAQVGRVLQGLAASGAADNTLVMLMGDHGFLLGEQRMWTKHALLEPALRTPLIIAHPDFVGGHEVVAVTDLLDVFPTVTELAGLEIPSGVQGESLQPFLRAPGLHDRQAKTGSISRWMNGESVRLGRYRYTRWFDDRGRTLEDMLFDIEADAYEQKNLASDSDYAGVINEMEDYLQQHRVGALWSTQLESYWGRWQLASSTTGEVLLVALAYPLAAGVALLFVIGGLVVGVARLVRGWRKRASGRGQVEA